jgi:hypothetical protein
MRRLIAALSLFSLANLVFVQGGGACPLNGDEHHAAGSVASDMTGHEGHHMATTSDDVAQPMPDETAPHAPACLTMACAFTLDIVRSFISASAVASVDRVVAASDHLPPSPVIAPEFPPPRT